jgi:hypothetical protein
VESACFGNIVFLIMGFRRYFHLFCKTCEEIPVCVPNPAAITEWTAILRRGSDVFVESRQASKDAGCRLLSVDGAFLDGTGTQWYKVALVKD